MHSFYELPLLFQIPCLKLYWAGDIFIFLMNLPAHQLLQNHPKNRGQFKSTKLFGESCICGKMARRDCMYCVQELMAVL